MTRADLITAQWAIFDNQLEEMRLPVRPESETLEYQLLHERYSELEAEVPWWRRILVWDQAHRTYPQRDELAELLDGEDVEIRRALLIGVVAVGAGLLLGVTDIFLLPAAAWLALAVRAWVLR